MTNHPFQATRAACAIVLSTAFTAAISGLLIVLPAQAETPPPPAQTAASGSQHHRAADSASTPHRAPLITRITTSGPSPVIDPPTREQTAEGHILERRSISSPSGDSTLETRTVLRRHDNRSIGDQRTGAPGVNYGPSRERSLQGRTSDSPHTVESVGFGYRRRVD